jgi:hypothetical protein
VLDCMGIVLQSLDLNQLDLNKMDLTRWDVSGLISFLQSIQVSPQDLQQVDWMSIQNILLGIGLSASCGFRVFLPCLVVSTAALYFGLQLPEDFQWMGTQTAFFISLTAAVIEVAAYYIPWVDNVLDQVAMPMSIIVGTAMLFGFLGDVPLALKLPIAVLAGGGLAGTFQGLTGLTRLGSSVTTMGLANPILATAETLMALFMPILSIVLPVLTLVFLLTLLIASIFVFRWLTGRKKKQSSQEALVSGTA